MQDPSEPAATAEIVDAKIGPAQVTIGDTLSVTVTVKNTWDQPLRTAGPPPGFMYEQYQSYRNMPVRQPGGGICTGRDAGGPLTAGAWRVAVGSTATSDGIADMPYRWDSSAVPLECTLMDAGTQCSILFHLRFRAPRD